MGNQITSFDFIGLLCWFPVATDQIVRLGPKMDRGVKGTVTPGKDFSQGQSKKFLGQRQRSWSPSFLLSQLQIVLHNSSDLRFDLAAK